MNSIQISNSIYLCNSQDRHIGYTNASCDIIVINSGNKEWELLPCQSIHLVKNSLNVWCISFERGNTVNVLENITISDIVDAQVNYINTTNKSLKIVYRQVEWIVYPNASMCVNIKKLHECLGREESGSSVDLSSALNKKCTSVEVLPYTQIFTYDPTISYPIIVPLPKGCNIVHITAVGGGGAAGTKPGSSYSFMKGGGAGKSNSVSLAVNPNTNVEVIVGKGGFPGNKPNGETSIVSYVAADTAFSVIGRGGICGGGKKSGLLPGEGIGGGSGAPGPLLSHETQELACGGNEDFLSTQGGNGCFGGGGGTGKINGGGGHGYVILTWS